MKEAAILVLLAAVVLLVALPPSDCNGAQDRYRWLLVRLDAWRTWLFPGAAAYTPDQSADAPPTSRFDLGSHFSTHRSDRPVPLQPDASRTAGGDLTYDEQLPDKHLRDEPGRPNQGQSVPFGDDRDLHQESDAAKVAALGGPSLKVGSQQERGRRLGVELASGMSRSGAGSVVCDVGRLGPVELRAVSATGNRHAVDGSLREDAYGFARVNANTVVLALADGLGSTRNAHAASSLAVDVAIRELSRAERTEVPWPTLAHGVFTHVARALTPDAVDAIARRSWAAVGTEVAALKHRRTPATTLVVAHIEGRSDGSHLLRAAAVGDSLIVHRPPGEASWKGLLPRGEVSPSVTSATPALPQSLDRLETAEVTLDRGACVLLCSDGMAETFTPGLRDEADPQLAHAWATPPDLEAFLHLVRLPLHGCVDDRTAVAAWLLHPGPSEPA